LAGGFFCFWQHLFSEFERKGMTQATPELLPAVGRRTGWKRGVELLHSRGSTIYKPWRQESIYILREAAAEFARPVMLYSIGKDSSVMLRLAQKAFFPGKIPFSSAARGTQLQIPRDDRISRFVYERNRRRADRPPEPRGA